MLSQQCGGISTRRYWYAEGTLIFVQHCWKKQIELTRRVGEGYLVPGNCTDEILFLDVIAIKFTRDYLYMF